MEGPPVGLSLGPQGIDELFLMGLQFVIGAMLHITWLYWGM